MADYARNVQDMQARIEKLEEGLRDERMKREALENRIDFVLSSVHVLQVAVASGGGVAGARTALRGAVDGVERDREQQKVAQAAAVREQQESEAQAAVVREQEEARAVAVHEQKEAQAAAMAREKEEAQAAETAVLLHEAAEVEQASKRAKIEQDRAARQVEDARVAQKARVAHQAHTQAQSLAKEQAKERGRTVARAERETQAAWQDAVNAQNHQRMMFGHQNRGRGMGRGGRGGWVSSSPQSPRPLQRCGDNCSECLKGRLCRTFNSGGFCEFGNRCKYAHECVRFTVNS
jgi:chemotaxis protein histidine kinase CheA